MSKLEDKLTASLKPNQAPAASRKSANKPKARPTPVSAAQAAQPDSADDHPADLNDSPPGLHPARIWPD